MISLVHGKSSACSVVYNTKDAISVIYFQENI